MIYLEFELANVNGIGLQDPINGLGLNNNFFAWNINLFENAYVAYVDSSILDFDLSDFNSKILSPDEAFAAVSKTGANCKLIDGEIIFSLQKTNDYGEA